MTSAANQEWGGPGARIASPEAHLASCGLRPERAIRRLTEAGLWTAEGPQRGTLDLINLISDAASPEDALVVVSDLAANHPKLFASLRHDHPWLRRLIAVAGVSRSLGDLLARHPGALERLRDPQPVDPAAVASEVSTALTDSGNLPNPAAAVAKIRRGTAAAIAARDLTGAAQLEEVTRDLARLAEGVLTGALAALQASIAGDTPAARLAIIGMGKLGGEELNYVSDIDVMFVHEPTAGDDAGAAREAQQVCLALLQLLNASTTMGRAYEVDPTLRPEGRDGPLSRTFHGYVAYWERWAETWEFQALLKARPVAGDHDLAARLITAAEPFVFPERPAPEIVSDVRDMKGRVEAKTEVRRDAQRQLKLGPGGIRDIEFAVQLLQLVHGRADPSVRERSTLGALSALAAGGYVAEDDATTFGAAYRWLRSIEHRLQLGAERRTHTLPSDPEQLERLARSLGDRADEQRPASEAFLARLKAVQGEVRSLHAKLFYRPLLEMHARIPASDAVIVRERFAEEAALARLEALGFRDAPGVLRDIRALTSGMTRPARTLRVVLPAMLHALSESPDPDGGLRALRTLLEATGTDPALVAILRDQPPTADLLARLLGTSEVVGELLITQPQGLQWLTDPTTRAEPRSREELVHAAIGLLRWQDELAGRQAALRRFKGRELARIVIRDLAADASATLVGQELTGLGEACLEAGLSAVLDELLAGTEEGAPARVAIVGLGKFGGHELHYVSDLDVVFIHEATEGAGEAEASAFAINIAERLLESLSAVTAEGKAFVVDAELRPEGRNGPLSRSLASYSAYYDRWSETWEHQALLRARRVAGHADLGRAFVSLASEYAYPEGFGPRRLTAIRKMKARIERERVPRRADPARHLKLGPGGLSDIEWTVQLLQQQHGRRDPRLRSPSTLTALDALQDVGIVEPRDAQWLREGYRFLTSIRNRLYLLRQRDVDVLPTSAALLERLGRSLGYGRGGRQELEADYLRHTRRIRRVTMRLFYERESAGVP
ncbi:MAG: bifunctional [glutamine synthetase] adenylyltransferase/[glutamine synthetase]-adenylyl-L-tyrosine phosphorylase [Nitriliruptorales bacterium]